MLTVNVKYQQRQLNKETTESKLIRELIDELIQDLQLNPGNNYGLIMQNYLMHKDQSLLQNQVKQGSVLELIQVDFGLVQVIYRNQVQNVYSNPNEQCQFLYNAVEQQFNLQTNQFTLQFNGRMLEKQRSIRDYGITYNSIIHVIIANSSLKVIICFENHIFYLTISEETQVSQIEQEIKKILNITSEIVLTTQNGLQLQSNQQLSLLPQQAKLTVSLKKANQQMLQTENQSILLLYIESQSTTIEIEVLSGTLVSDLGLEIRKFQAIQEPVQILFKGLPLPQNQSLCQSGIQNHTFLQVKPIQESLQSKKIILVIQYQNQTKTFEVEDTKLVIEVVTLVKDLLGITGNVFLSYQGLALNSNLSFLENNISNYSLIQVENTPPQIFLQNQYLIHPQDNYVGYRIFIEIEQNGQVFGLFLDSSTLISELKALLLNQLNISQEAAIFYQGQQLQSNLSLIQLNIPNESLLIFKLLQNLIEQPQIQQEEVSVSNQALIATNPFTEEIDLIICGLEGDLHIKVCADCPVCELIDIIKEQKEIYRSMELIYGEQVLKSSQTLREQQIPSGTYLILRQADTSQIQTRNNFKIL